MTVLKGLRHGILNYFGGPRTKLPLNARKPKNNTFQRWKNTTGIIINHKGTKMVKDGED